MTKTLLEGLTEEQLKEEKSLRKRVIEKLKKYHENRFGLGKALVEIHDKIIGEKRFKKYLEPLGIPRSCVSLDGRLSRVLKTPQSLCCCA